MDLFIVITRIIKANKLNIITHHNSQNVAVTDLARVLQNINKIHEQ